MTEYTFFNNSMDTPVLTNCDVEWKWIAMYNDGTMLSQYQDSDLTFHQFREIDQSRLHSFSMVSDNHPPITLLFEQGMKLIHFYRNTMMNLGDSNEIFIRLYCFGYELNGVKVIIVIMPNGSIAIVDDVNKIKLQ